MPPLTSVDVVAPSVKHCVNVSVFEPSSIGPVNSSLLFVTPDEPQVLIEVLSPRVTVPDTTAVWLEDPNEPDSGPPPV